MAGPAAQVEALAALFNVKSDVSKEVHIRCVQNALASVVLDGPTALHVSGIIEQQPSFSPEDKKVLQECLAQQVEDVGKAKVTRRCYQDYTSMENFLTEEVWDALSKFPFTRAADVLMNHVIRLGLRTPSEPTYAAMTALLCIYGAPMSNFSLSQTYETTKKTWNSVVGKVKKSEKKDGTGEKVHLAVLPSVEALPGCLKCQAFGTHPRVESRIRDSSLKDLERKIIMRKSHMLSPKNAAAQAVALGGNGQPQVSQPGLDLVCMPVVGQLINALAMVAGANRQDVEIPIQMLRRSSTGSLSGSADQVQQVQALAASAPSQQSYGPATTALVVADPGLAKLQPEMSSAANHSTALVPPSQVEKLPQEIPEQQVADKEVSQVQQPSAVEAAEQMVLDLEARKDKKAKTSHGENGSVRKRPAAAKTPAALPRKPSKTKKQVSAGSGTAQQKVEKHGRGLKRPAASPKNAMPKSDKKKLSPSEKKKAMSKSCKKLSPSEKKKAVPKKVKRALKMDPKNIHSRKWHEVRDLVYRKSGDDDLARRKASVAAKKAVQDFLKKSKK
eukprot:s395_g13.t1